MDKIYQKTLLCKKHVGFTLIELLVIVLIVGILAAVALPQYQKAVAKARGAEALSNIKAVAQAAEVYRMENGKWPEDFGVLAIALPWPPQEDGNKVLGTYYNYILTDGRMDAPSRSKDRYPSFLYASDLDPMRPAAGKRYYCYYNPTGDAKRDAYRESLCKMYGGEGPYAVAANSIWFALD